ncbi:NAD(P)H nitroreductase [Actinoplanes capillaceus]|uniref:NAD(P)H nitroreductase n=1 Tax=Actinoplanes campanulatus TaxID=113559 RepID=A0ABQ3WPW7_9ACTN|nr:nitroreductase [Actinoplanes capillaceus]GID48337.1 NAD(P)H nitroreductase [Actinoplanes capillaceus]
MTAATLHSARPASPRLLTQALYRAAVAAGLAPSAYNTQPWRWRLTGDAMDLYLDPDRMIGVRDPAGHLAMISCGAALHHARLTLAARGWRVTVTRRPGQGSTHHVAHLHIDGPAPVSAGTARLARAIRQRHTDLRPVTGSPIRPPDLRTISQAFTSHDISVHILRPDEVLALTVAAAHAEHAEAAEAQWYEQLALWTGAGRIVGTVDRLRLPTRPGDHDRAATFAVLHGRGDQDIEWLHAGEALSTGWLVATQLGMSALPFSAPIENTRARETLRRAVPDLNHPYVMVRLGRHTSAASAAHSVRLDAAEIIGHHTP